MPATWSCRRCPTLLALGLATLLAARAEAEENDQPNAVIFKTVAALNEGGIGIGFTHDFAATVRAGVAAGAFAAGDGSQNWQEVTAGVRLLGRPLPDKGGGFHLSLFGTVGLARYYNFQKPDGFRTHRETLDAAPALELDATNFGQSGRGFTARLSVGALIALWQEAESHPPLRVWEEYSISPFASVSLGYSF